MKKELSVILQIPEECPLDFYKSPSYLAAVKEAKVVASSLVHEISDEGRKLAKADAAAIRKYCKTTDGFCKTIFESLTGKVKVWRESFTTETKELNAIADSIMEKFEAMEELKLDTIHSMIVDRLEILRKEQSIESRFVIEPTFNVTLSGWLTPQGNLTSKALSEINAAITEERASQLQYHARVTKIKMICLEEGIELIPETYFGADLVGTDVDFETKLVALVEQEVARKEAMIKKIETDRLKEALRQEQIAEKLEADKQRELARSEAIRSVPVAPTPAPVVDSRETIAPINEPNIEPKSQPEPQAFSRKVRFVMTFEASVKTTTTVEQFKAMIKSEVVCSGRALKALISEEVFDI